MLLAELGIQYNISDSDTDSDSGGGIIVASFTVDFVQRFNFSVAEDGTISFRSPQARTEGYVPMLVFDKAGASTVLAESIFYNLKARPPGAVVCANGRAAETSCNSALTCSVASLVCAVPPGRLVRERGGLHTVPKGALRLCDLVLAAHVDRHIEAFAKQVLVMGHAVDGIVADGGQGAMCPGGFRMWPLEGYWNEGEVRTLFLGHVLALPMKRFPFGGAQDAKSVRPCSPPSLGRCRGGRITDSPPYIRATGYNGCGIAFAGAPSAFFRTHLLSCCHGLCTLRAGPYCSLCASGYFRKGKTCAPCDAGTKNVMYANVPADCSAWCGVLRQPTVCFAQGWALPPDSSARSCSGSLSCTPRLCLPSLISWQRGPLCADYTHMHAKTRTH
jgi:hypothetical protein